MKGLRTVFVSSNTAANFGWHRQARENGINLLGLKRLVACNRLFWSTHFRNYANNNLALPSGKHLESFPFVQPPTLTLPLGEMRKIFRPNFHTGLQKSTQASQKAFISNERRERDDDESSATFDVIFLLKKWETLYSGCGRCRGIFSSALPSNGKFSLFVLLNSLKSLLSVLLWLSCRQSFFFTRIDTFVSDLIPFDRSLNHWPVGIDKSSTTLHGRVDDRGEKVALATPFSIN